MDKQIRRLGVALLLLLLGLLVQIDYVQVFAADRLSANPANAARQQIAEYDVDRGAILAADGSTVLAVSRKSTGVLRYRRRYPNGPLYADVTGYYSPIYGTSGLERAYDAYLSGSAAELVPQTLADLILGRPKRGASIVTTIDPNVQRAAEHALHGLPGAVVAIEPSTGNVLALYANPTFDPNQLAAQDEATVRAAWRRLNADPSKPLVSRADAELFPPGSTYKLVTTSAALRNGYGPNSTWPNPRVLDLPNTTHDLRNFGNEHCLGGVSRISLADALRVSCNVVFGEVGLNLGAEALAAQARAFGFAPDASSGNVPFDIPFQAGVFPDPGYYEQRLPAVALAAIGQDDVTANPMQMALVGAAIANGGVEMRPRLVTEIRSPNGQILKTFEPHVYSRPLTAQNAALLTRMMVSVVEAGTGTAARIPGVEVAGKTGTAQHGEGLPPHAWFVSFAPADSPQVAVAVIVLDGGSLGSEATGGRVAAPIAKAVMEAVLT